jgi:hypothetical protein
LAPARNAFCMSSTAATGAAGAPRSDRGYRSRVGQYARREECRGRSPISVRCWIARYCRCGSSLQQGKTCSNAISRLIAEKERLSSE